MAYRFTNAKAYQKACKGTLEPVQGGLKYTASRRYTFEDEIGDIVVIEKGDKYAITGTKDSNGYVVTILTQNDETHLLAAEIGCQLC